MARELDKFLKEDEVLHITSLSRATIWREIKAGRFPQPVPISAGRVGWRSSMIASWQQDPGNWKPQGAA